MAAVYKTISQNEKNKRSSSINGTKEGNRTQPIRQRVLILSSRGVTHRFVLLHKHYKGNKCQLTMKWRHRHLLNDLYSLLPHSRKDAKLDTKSKLYQLNEIADLYNCNNVLFFEARKGKDLYVWMSKAPNGPTVKMHLQNRMSTAYSAPVRSYIQRTVLLTLLLHQCTQWKSSISQEIVSKVLVLFSPLMLALTPLRICVYWRNSSCMSLASLRDLGRQSHSLTMSWASPLLITKSGYAATR